MDRSTGIPVADTVDLPLLVQTVAIVHLFEARAAAGAQANAAVGKRVISTLPWQTPQVTILSVECRGVR